MENIFFNVLKIRSRAFLNGGNAPRLGALCTLCNANLKTLPELCSLVHASGFQMLTVTDVTELDGLKDEYKSVLHFSEHSREECQNVIHSTLLNSRKMGLPVVFEKSFLDAINGQQGRDVPMGMTRACKDPWSMLYFSTNGDISTCCAGYPPVAHISAVNSMREIYFSDKNTRCKSEILTGNLQKECVTCPRRPITTVGDFIDSFTH